jgi:hypothetical protein
MVKVEKVVLEVNDKKIELSLEEAESLFKVLGDLFKKEIVYVPKSRPVVPIPYYPWYPSWTDTTYIISTTDNSGHTK